MSLYYSLLIFLVYTVSFTHWFKKDFIVDLMFLMLVILNGARHLS